jgi:hypothetical protein
MFFQPKINWSGGEDATEIGLKENRERNAPGGSEVNPAARWISRRILPSSVYAEAPRWLFLTAGLRELILILVQKGAAIPSGSWLET